MKTLTRSATCTCEIDFSIKTSTIHLFIAVLFAAARSHSRVARLSRRNKAESPASSHSKLYILLRLMDKRGSNLEL